MLYTFFVLALFYPRGTLKTVSFFGIEYWILKELLLLYTDNFCQKIQWIQIKNVDIILLHCNAFYTVPKNSLMVWLSTFNLWKLQPLQLFVQWLYSGSNKQNNGYCSWFLNFLHSNFGCKRIRSACYVQLERCIGFSMILLC